MIRIFTQTYTWVDLVYQIDGVLDLAVENEPPHLDALLHQLLVAIIKLVVLEVRMVAVDASFLLELLGGLSVPLDPQEVKHQHAHHVLRDLYFVQPALPVANGLLFVGQLLVTLLWFVFLRHIDYLIKNIAN